MEKQLRKLFGQRVTFDQVECMLYSHDVANLPSAVEALVHKNADAVVQPISVEEVIALVQFAREKKIPLTPRGAGTSGYGGVIPIKKGIVVAFTRMNRILHIDKENQTVTVEPGVIWSKLEESLNTQGLSLRLYPSSAPSATVGGWIGEGGSGIGSYEYGFFDDNVLEVKALTPQGRLQTFRDSGLDIINRAEGTTGFAVEITLAVRELDQENKVLTAFSRLSDLIAAIKKINEAALPLWHINFTTADFIKNKAEAVEKSLATALRHHDNFVGQGIPRDHHLLLVVYPAKRYNQVEPALKKILEGCRGEILEEAAANLEWADRFYTMRVKTLGPSLIPSEAILPLDSAAKVIIEGLLKRGVKEIVISCPGCYMAFAHAYPQWAKKLGYPYDFKLKHISEKAEELIQAGKLKFKQPVHKKITWHDSCHIGRHSGIYEAPRNVLKAIPGIEYVEMEHNRENALCCGSVLTRIGEPPVADKLGSMRVQEAENIGAEALLATCPCCEVQLRASAKNTGIHMTVQDFTNLVAEALGYEVHDDSEFTLFMWGIFEKALEIMTVEGIVDMMSDMLPEIMDAMPGAMKPLLKGMEALPGPIQDPPLALMEKMIPTLMPLLLPSMMPKLMPKILELMKQYIPDMPEQMEEKLPVMLPAVMDKIMPAMLPQVAPRLAPKMTEYMRRR